MTTNRWLKESLCAAMLFTGIAAFSQAWSAAAPLNTNATTDAGDDESVQLATDGNGNWVAVWESDENLGGVIGTDLDILVSRSSDHGATWSAPAALNTNAAVDSDDDEAPHVATDGLGTWIAMWDGENPYDIRYSRSTDNGATWSAPTTLASVGNDYWPKLAADGNGNWLAVWSCNNPDLDIFFSRSTDGGLNWSVPAALNSNAATDTGADWHPCLVTNGNGNWIVSWYSDDDLGIELGTDYDILYSRSADHGATWSAVNALNTNASLDEGSDSDVTLATDGNGTWIAAWNSTDPLNFTIGTDTDILWSRSTDNGSTWTAPAPLNATAATDNAAVDREPCLRTDGNGTWMAIWESSNSLGSTIGTDRDILYATSVDAGTTWSNPAAASPNAATDSGNDESPCMATDGNGVWIAAWPSDDTLGGTIGADLDILFSRNTTPDADEGMACGSVLAVTAVEAGIATFTKKPKVYATYYDPVKDPGREKPKKASLKVLTKVDKAGGATSVTCEWTKKIRLYDAKGFKTAQTGGESAETWIPAHQEGLSVDLRVASKEIADGDQALRSAMLTPPEILNADDDIVNGIHYLYLEGNWFGTKKPKVWREYEVDDGAGGFIIKQQKLKVLKPADPKTLDSKEKCAYMDAATGRSLAIAILPDDPKGELNGVIVIENGVGLATTTFPGGG